MNTKNILNQNEFSKFIHQLSSKSIKNYYNPYQLFTWPEYLAEKAYWISPDLISIYDTSLMEEFDETKLQILSKWESINFYSLNVHGIKELLIEVVKRIHTADFELSSDFFHHFIGEENEHMWFFAKFCRRYGGKIYPSSSLKIFNTDHEEDKDVENFLIFARIFLFEEIVDFYNLRMAKDERLHPVIRQINYIHHQDEARHIAFGRKLVAYLYEKIIEKLSTTKLKELENYLKHYIIFCLKSFYNPYAYKDAGIKNPLEFRAQVINSESRRKKEREILHRVCSFCLKIGIFTDDTLPEMTQA